MLKEARSCILGDNAGYMGFKVVPFSSAVAILNWSPKEIHGLGLRKYFHWRAFKTALQRRKRRAEQDSASISIGPWTRSFD